MEDAMTIALVSFALGAFLLITAGVLMFSDGYMPSREQESVRKRKMKRGLILIFIGIIALALGATLNLWDSDEHKPRTDYISY